MKSILSLMIIALSLLSDQSFASLVGVWGNKDGKFQFESNGQALMQWADGNRLSGQWQFDQQQLIITTTNGRMQFQAHLKGNQLTLVDRQGFYQLQRQKSVKPKTRQPAASDNRVEKKPRKAPLTHQEYISFLQSYPKETASYIYRELQSMTKEQLMNFDIWPALGSDIYTRLCKGGYTNIIWQASINGPVGCQQLFQWEVQAQQLGGTTQEAEFQRFQVINMMKCSSGETDKSTCRSYSQTLKSYHQGSNKTLEAINKGFEAPPCTQYYDQNNVYQGCW